MIVHVAAALIYREGRLLAARRADGGQDGRWELPGGKIEEGEKPVEALRREVREELGCELGTAWLYDTVEHDYPDFHLAMDCFVCQLPAGAEPSPHQAVHSPRAPSRGRASASTPSCAGSLETSCSTSSGFLRTSR